MSNQPSDHTPIPEDPDFSIGGEWIIECLGFDLENTNSINCRRYRDQWQKKERIYATTDWKLIKVNFNNSISLIKEKLGSIIKKYASFEKQIVSDEEIERPPFEYADFEKVENRLRGYAQGVSGPITMDGLRAKGEHHLVTCIYRYHGGWEKVAKRLGLTTAQRPKSALKDFGYVKECLEKITVNFGHFPNSAEVREKDGSLYHAIAKYHGGWHGVAKTLGFATALRPSGVLKDFEYVKECLEAIAARLGHFPSSMDVLREDSGLLTGIQIYHGGWVAVAKCVGHSHKPVGRHSRVAPRPSGTLKDFEYVRRCLETIAARLGHFPNSKEVRFDDNGLLQAICKYHGGWTATIKRLGHARKPATDEPFLPGFGGGRSRAEPGQFSSL